MSVFDNQKELAITSQMHKQLCLVQIKEKSNIDLYNCTELFDFLKQINVNEIEGYIIDISFVDYIDSSGFGAFINFARLCDEKKKKLYILNPPKSVKHIFQIVGLERYFILISELP